MANTGSTYRHISKEALAAVAKHLECNTLINLEDRAEVLDAARDLFRAAATRMATRGLGKHHIKAVLDSAVIYGEEYLNQR